LQLRLVSSWGRSAPLYGSTRLAMNFTTLCIKKAQLSPTTHAMYLHKRWRDLLRSGLLHENVS